MNEEDTLFETMIMEYNMTNHEEYDDEVLDDPRRGQAESLNRGIY